MSNHENINSTSIAEKFMSKKDNFELLVGTIVNCIRNIDIYKILGQAKQKFEIIENESFVGWVQNKCLIKLIVIESFDISKNIEKNVRSIIKNILPLEMYEKILKKSNLHKGLKKLRKVTEPFREHRNTRFAHLDLEKVTNNIFINFQAMRDPLLEIYSSLKYIYNYMINQHCSSELNNFPNYKIFENDLANDPIKESCGSLIKKLAIISKKKINML